MKTHERRTAIVMKPDNDWRSKNTGSRTFVQQNIICQFLTGGAS